MAAAVTIGPCQGCGACLLTCPAHAIRPYGGRLRVLADRCTGCGECTEVCPADAIDGPATSTGDGPATSTGDGPATSTGEETCHER